MESNSQAVLSQNQISPKISVTIPVYNTSKYLRKCLDSLVAQTADGIEFIMVDDGSMDNSGQICDEYANKDFRFRVIHQMNGGLALARQTGLNAAKGEYVIVCDSDDWVEPDMYESLYRIAKDTDADIVCCGYYAEYDDGRSVAKQTIFKENCGIVDNFDFFQRGAGSSWIKLIRRSLFDKAGANYTPGVNLGEDALIIYKLMKANPLVVQLPGYYYHYRRQYNGETYTNSLKMTNIIQLKVTYDWLKDNYIDDIYESLRFSRAIDLAFAALRSKDLDKHYLKSFLSEELPFTRFIRNKISRKSLLVLLEKYISIGLAQSLLNSQYKKVYK